MKNITTIEDLRDYLNKQCAENPEDDCINIVKDVCRENGWLYTDDTRGYYDTDFCSNGLHLLYWDENGGFKIRYDENAIEGALMAAKYRYSDNGDGTYDVCYDHKQDTYFSPMNMHHVATVKEDADTWYVDNNCGLGYGEYPKKDWTLVAAIKDQCGE